MLNFDEDVAIKPQQEPEVVALKDQNVEDVKRLIEEAQECERKWQEKKFNEIKEHLDELTEDAEEVKLSYYDELKDCGLPDVSKNRSVFNKEIDTFALWRKLADVPVGDKSLEPKMLNPTKDLMDFVLLKLNKSFPKLNIDWTDGWNPRLSINNCPTQISMEKLGLAYQGLVNITDELNAQAVLTNIVIKKLKELFI